MEVGGISVSHLENHTCGSPGMQAGGRDWATMHLHSSFSRPTGESQWSRNEVREVSFYTSHYTVFGPGCLGRRHDPKGPAPRIWGANADVV